MRDSKVTDKIIITEDYPSSIISDFKIYLTYLKANPIKLTKTNGYFTKKDLLAIYPQLKSSTGDVPLQMTQTGFPIIHLFYWLSIELDIIRIKSSKTSKSALIQDQQIDHYLKLTSSEQYVTLLEAFWTKLDWKDLQSRVPNQIDFLFEELEGFPANQSIKVKRYEDLDDILSDFGLFFHFFKYFGLWTFELNDKAFDEKFDCTHVTLTPFFKEIEFALRETWRPYEDAGLKQSMELFSALFGTSMEDEWEEEEEKESLVTLLSPLFPDLNQSLNKTRESITGTFRFLVNLGSSCSRTLQLSSSHTLLDLHELIQKAFDFDDDHLYAFYMDGKKFGKQAYHSPMGGPGPSVQDVTIGSLNLYEGQGFLYLFDFGDEWEFYIQVVKIEEGKQIETPKIVHSIGEAPAQYEW